MALKIPVGVSSCILGENVRFDGGHCRDRYICDCLTEYLEFVSICPEMAIGLGSPRPSIRLRRDGDQMRAISAMEADITDTMTTFSQDKVKTLETLSGYILKSKSPTCGMERVRVYDENMVPKKNGVGLYAQALMATYPNLPIEEEGRLNDAFLRENFIERIFLYHEWQQVNKNSVNDLMLFHQRHKYSLMSHSQAGYKSLGQLIGNLRPETLGEQVDEYSSKLMMYFKSLATRANHTNVLTHIYGYFKHELSDIDKKDMLSLIEEYRLHKIPLIVPIKMIHHHAKHYKNEYLENQSYFNPYPDDLKLRNFI